MYFTEEIMSEPHIQWSQSCLGCRKREYGGWVQEKECHSVCPQLCCLHADMLSSLGPKEAKKAFLDFYHSFLEKTAVRHLPAAPIPLPVSTCGGACQPWSSPVSSHRPFSPRPPAVHFLPPYSFLP